VNVQSKQRNRAFAAQTPRFSWECGGLLALSLEGPPLFFQTGVQSRHLFSEVQTMRKFWFATICALLLSVVPVICNAQVDSKWKIHDLTRPLPPVIEPGTSSTQDLPGRPPSDAVVLFDGKDLSKWAHKDGSAAKWKVENGYVEVVAKTGYIYTREAFRDC